VPALAARRLRDGDASTARRGDTTRRRTSFIAHLSHANRQPQGTASNVTGLPHLPVHKSISESGTRPCWLERAVIDHNATPSSWRRVDGVEVMIQQSRGDNLIYALAFAGCDLGLLCLGDRRGHHAWDRRAEPRGGGAASSPMPLLCLSSVDGQPD